MPELVVVTGASSGIGRAAALRFAREGHRVVAVARTRSKLEELEREGGGRIEVEAIDAADGAQVHAMAERVRARFGAPWVLLNSAGAGRWLDIEDTSPEELRDMMGAPFGAAFHMCAAFVPSMRARGRGVLMHVGSPVSIMAWPGATAYACSRWALRGLHESLRADLAGTGVESCHVIFGEVTSSYFENNPGAHDRIPKMGRIIPKMSPEQCADVLYEVAQEPCAERIEPLVLRLMAQATSVAPAVTRELMVRTGRRR